MRFERLDATEVERLGGPRPVAAHIRALTPGGASVSDTVAQIVEEVRAGGDPALAHLIRRLDTGGVEPRPLRVAEQELDDAIRSLSLDVVAGLQVTIANVAQVADAWVRGDSTLALPQGHTVTLREIPVGAAAVYVPGGRAPYLSTVAMGVVTARAAGVVDVAVCSPPSHHGDIHPALLGACRLCGVTRVYRMGGAHAVAALALGTDTVDPVDVIVGPGNLYVQEAKRQLSHAVGTDGFAGPSDLVIILGEDNEVEVLRCGAMDLLAQAEHRAGSMVALICTSAAQLDRVREQLELLGAAPEPAPHPAPGGEAVCVLVGARDAREALEIANEIAPEHLQLMGAEVEALAPAVRTAGALFVGPDSATAFGDYVAGSNHVLPTGGAARFSSGLSPAHFRRRMAEVRITGAAARKLAAAGAPIARAEGFEAHARSMEARIGDNLQQ
ncbi:MAG: histidinol dehydrogenase [Solirubrobacterales bacterium]|nr:histidinol dehydrogenase [Solirubrobacterales bacterium]